jgi:hypothetical protein
MTILIGFHQSCYRNFKTYYHEKVQTEWADAFPGLVSYQRFPFVGSNYLSADVRLLALLFGQCRGISFIDSTALRVCHNRRIKHHKVFEDLAARGKTSVDWFFGFKLHLVVMTEANCST